MPHDQPVIEVTVADGHRFELIDVPAERAAHILLFLPGMGLSARLFIPFARSLAKRGFHVYIHEWRGNGSSNRRASRDVDWGYAELLDDLAAARAAIVARGHGDLFLGGHSLGSQLACLSAALEPDGCRGLVIAAGGSPYWRVFPLPMKLVMIGVMSVFPVLGAAFGYYPGKRVGFAGNEARQVMSDWARSARSGRYEPAGVEADLEARLRELALPVLAVDMADDWFVPTGSLGWLLGKLAHCRIERETVHAEDGKADHYAWMRHPGPTADAIERWANSLS
jgi:predicted alpha/beta hydrolase